MSAKTTRLRSYRSLLRMAKVRESLAAAELEKAVGEERERRNLHRRVAEQREAVARASLDCQGSHGRLDLARLEMLSMLDVALYGREQRAEQSLAEAEQHRSARAQANWQAKRYRERVDEQLKDARGAWLEERAAKVGEELLELWIERREGEA